MFTLSTRKVGRVRLLRIGRLAFAFAVLGNRAPSRRTPVWLAVDGTRLHLPEIAL